MMSSPMSATSSPKKRKSVRAVAETSASRVEKWAKARQSGLVVPLLAQGVRRSKHKAGVRVNFGRVDGFKLPAAFLKERKGATKTKLHFCVHVSLFHTTSQSFFGNTWVSPLSAASASMSSRRATRLDLSAFQVALCTRIADPACLAVVEVVVVEKDISGSEVLGQYGCGWTSIPLFSMAADLSGGSRKSSHSQKVKMYSGSPRALLFLDDETVEKDEALRPMQDCSLSFSCVADPLMAKVAHLVRLNELIGPGQTLPGVREGKFPAKATASVKFVSTMDLYINSVAILLPAQWEERAEEYLRMRQNAGPGASKKKPQNAASFDSDDDHDAVDRRHRRPHGEAASSRLLLKVAPHNGRTIVDKNGWTQVPLKDVDYGGHPDYDRVLQHTGPVALRNFPKDPQVALAFQLEYHPARKLGTAGPVVVGCGVWLPFGTDKSGPQLVLANIRAKTASTKSPLQVPLRADLQCPFTDEGVFLPMRQDAVLPILGVHLDRKPQRLRLRFDGADTDESDGGRRPRKGSSRRRSRDDWLDGSDADSDFESRSSDASAASSDFDEGNDSADLDSDARSREDNNSEASSVYSASSAYDDEKRGRQRRRQDRRHSHSRGRRRGIASEAQRRSLSRGRVASKLGEVAAAGRAPLLAEVDNSLLARTLNLRIHDENAPDAAVNSQSFTTLAHDPEQHKGASRPMELSRASRTVLNRMGVLDSMRTVVAPMQSEPSIDIEMRDRLTASEVTFQFAAYRHALGDPSAVRPRSIFFTFQFYNALPTRTERMSLRAPDTRDRDAEMGLSKPFLLMRSAEKYRNSPSQALKYLVDCSLADADEPRRFAQYLQKGTLHIQLWDGDSLLSLGVIAVRLADLMRQGERSVKVAREFDVIAPSGVTSSSGVQEIDLYEGAAARGLLRGKVQLVITNHGLKGRGKRASSDASAAAANADARWRMERAFGADEKDADGTLVQQESSGTGPRHRVIARPLAQTNAQLEDLLKAAKSTSRRRIRRDHGRLQIADGAVLESDWALSESELRRLAKMLDRANSGLVQVSALHAYLRIDETSARDASRVWATLRACDALCAPDTYYLFNNADLEHTGCVPETVFADILRKFVDDGLVADPELDLLAKRFQEGEGRVNYERFMKQLVGSHVSDLESKLRRVLRKAKASSGLSYKEAFQHHFDANGDGRVEARELKRGLQGLNFLQTSKADIDLLLERYGDGKGLLLSDFVALAEASPQRTHSPNAGVPSKGDDVKIVDKVRAIVLESERRGVNVRDAFAHFDKDGNGRISTSECKTGLREIGVEASSHEIDELIAAVDADGSGEVELDEFVGFLRAPAAAATAAEVTASTAAGAGAARDAEKNGSDLVSKVRAIVLKAKDRGVNIRDTFAHFDKDGNGLITKKECEEGLASIGCSFSPEELDELFAALDLDSDGNVNMVEFIAFLADENGAAKAANKDRATDVALGHLREVLQAQPKARIERAFPFLAKDKKRVDSHTLAKGLRALGFDALRPEHVETVLQHFNEEGDGSVSVTAFRDFVRDSQDALARARNIADDAADRDAEDTPMGFLAAYAERIKKRCRKQDRKDTGTISRSRFNGIMEDLGWDGDEISREDIRDLVTPDSGRIEYERIGKDVVREKLTKAVGKAYDKGINVADMLQALDRQGLGKISVSQIRRLVIDLGFSVLEHQGSQSSAGRGPSGGMVRDALSSRQQSKIERLRSARMIGHSKSGMYEDLSLADEDLGDAFARQASELQLVRRFREGYKRDVVGSLLRTSMTKEITVHPSFASASYFEVELANPFPHEEAFQIKFDDPELRCLTDGAEWRYYRERVPAICKPDAFYPVESEMMTPDTLELSLGGGEAVAVPFTFVSFASGQPDRDARGCIRERTIIVRFVSSRHANAILELQVHVKPKPFVVHRSIELHAGVGEFAKAQVRIHASAGADERFVYCGDPDAAVEWKDNVVSIRHRGKDALGEFFVVLYKDPFHAEMEAIWLVSVQPMQRVNFHGVVGQSASSELIVKGDNFSRRVQCFTSNPGETRLHPSDPFQLVAGAFNRIELVHQPLVETPPGCTQQVRVHMVDLDSHELVSAWLVKATAALPDISKTFEVDLSLHHAAHKKIAYVNPWNEPRVFTIRSSDPAYARAKDPELEVPPKSKAYIRLWFAAVHNCTSRQVLIFVNDAHGQNEECLLLKTRHK